MNVVSLYTLPLVRSSHSFQWFLMVYITLGIIASIPLYTSLKKSFRKNIKYVYVIFILLLLSPVLSILTNELLVQLGDNRRSLFKPYNFSSSIYHEQKDFDVWWLPAISHKVCQNNICNLSSSVTLLCMKYIFIN